MQVVPVIRPSGGCAGGSTPLNYQLIDLVSYRRIRRSPGIGNGSVASLGELAGVVARTPVFEDAFLYYGDVDRVPCNEAALGL